MPWYAKPSGGYHYNSVEGRANINMMNGFFNGEGYTIESQAGMFGNVYNESSLNPWRWQYDRFSLSLGYGLFQFTEARDYINNCQSNPGYGPNLSVSTITQGARPEDGWSQCIAMSDDQLSKWTSWCWRNYWDRNTWSHLWSERQRILNTWGDGSSITLAQFKQITDIYDAVFVFLACYEGPPTPGGYTQRCTDAAEIYRQLTGQTPPDPPGPGPGPTPTGSKFNIMFYLKPKRKRLM